jgi:hypothetical protein
MMMKASFSFHHGGVADLHHFNADPNPNTTPALHSNADPNPVMGIGDH